MDEIRLTQNADFLSIALESIESGSHDVAVDFIEDVADDLDDESQSESLCDAIDTLQDGDTDGAYATVEEICSELLNDADAV